MWARCTVWVGYYSGDVGAFGSCSFLCVCLYMLGGDMPFHLNTRVFYAHACAQPLFLSSSVFSVFGLLWNDTQCHVNSRLFNTRFRQEDDVDDHDDNNESQPRINITTTSTTIMPFQRSSLCAGCAGITWHRGPQRNDNKCVYPQTSAHPYTHKHTHTTKKIHAVCQINFCQEHHKHVRARESS